MQNYGNPDAPITVIAEPGCFKTKGSRDLFWEVLKDYGFGESDCYVVYAFPQMPKNIVGSDSKEGQWIKDHRPDFLERLELSNSKVALALGKNATRACSNKAVRITRVRGQAWEYDDIKFPVMTAYAPNHVLRRPELLDIFTSDLFLLQRLCDVGWDLEALLNAESDVDYEWVDNLQFLIDMEPAVLAVDTETTGLDWYRDDVKTLTVQLSWAPGKAVSMCIHRDYWETHTGEVISRRAMDKRVRQLTTLLENPKIKKVAHHMSYDHHILKENQKIDVANWWMDTQVMAFAADDNMKDKSQSECVRRWVPAMAGYCMVPSTEVLTGDLRHVPVGSLKVGDELLGFDEHSPAPRQRRKMRTTRVTSTGRKHMRCVKVTTESGRVVTVSQQHKFLSRSFKGGNWGWREAAKLKVGEKLHPFPWEKQRADFDGGYMGGIYDGEGWVKQAKEPGLKMGFAQVKGLVMDKSLSILEQDGLTQWLSLNEDKRKPVVNAVMSANGTMRAMQLYRPLRLLAKRPWEGKCLPRSKGYALYDRVVSVEPAGIKEVVTLATEHGTLIAEGLCQHNSDVFDRKTDKSRMIDVHPDDMLQYGCGDADSLYRLASRLYKIIKEDDRQWQLLEKVQMPALRAFSGCVEEYGVQIDKEELDQLQEQLNVEFARINDALLELVPPAVKRKHVAANKALTFTRPDFIRDILFTADGYNLKPIVFTKGTMNEENPEDRVPSTSAKNHLAFFDDNEFIELYTHWAKLTKMRSTYVGTEWDDKKNCATGFYQYLHNNVIHPSFNIHGTVTGRTSSRNPNAQNFPKRGDLAKSFRKVFVARPGYTLIESDLSQAELRIAAWMAHEEKMLSIYLDDGDIHSATAAAVLGVDEALFATWKGNDTLLMSVANKVPGSGSILQAMNPGSRKKFTLGDFHGLQRFRAKAVNFGFLYGMGWRKFKVYAKTDYGLTYTDEEAQATRDTFFNLYPGLAEWHKDMESFVRDYGYVRSLHGALRRLPNVFSSEETMQWSAIRQGINSPVQRFASDLGLIALARVVRDCPKDIVRPILFIHDALILEVKDEHLDEICAATKFYMESTPLEAMFGLVSPIPIKADVAVGKTLSGMDELKGVEAIAPDWYNADADKEYEKVY